MDNIVIQFNPFGISDCPEGADIESYSFEVNGENVSGSDDVEWCSLPDILLDKNSRQFIGLSFSVNDEFKGNVQKLVYDIANDSCRYISNSSNTIRYQGFDDNDRFEVYWYNSNCEVACEFASLYEGCWLYTDSERNKDSIAIPYGYWLSLVNEIKGNYNLT